MDILKYIPGFRAWMQETHGRDIHPDFAAITNILQETGDRFTAQGREDARSGIPPRFEVVFSTIVGVDSAADSSYCRLFRLCYEEGYGDRTEE